MISERKKKKLKRRRRNIIIVISVIFVSVCGYYAVNNQFIRGLYYKNSEDSFKNIVNEEKSGVSSDYIIKENILFSYSKNGLFAYNQSGERIIKPEYEALSEILSDFNDPVLRTCEKYIIAYDRMGKSLILFDLDGIKHNIKTEYPIISAKPLDSGYFILITEDASAKNQALIYNNEALKIFAYHSGTDNILDCSLSNDNKKLVVLNSDISTGNFNSKLLFFNIDNEKPFADKVFEGVLITNINYYNRSSLIAISDSKVIYIKDNSDIIAEYSYNDRLLSKYRMLENGSIVLSFKGNSSYSAETEIISNSGKLKGSYNTEDEVLFIDYKNGNIMLCQKRNVDIITKNAIRIRRIDNTKDLKKAYFISNNKITLIGNSEVKIIN